MTMATGLITIEPDIELEYGWLRSIQLHVSDGSTRCVVDIFLGHKLHKVWHAELGERTSSREPFLPRHSISSNSFNSLTDILKVFVRFHLFQRLCHK